MIKLFFRAAGFGIACLLVNPAFAVDARNGAALAKQWCSSCHLVERGQKGSTTEATPFATVARRPGFNVGKLAFFLLDPHPKMPNMQLSRNEAADLAAYISTLR